MYQNRGKVKDFYRDFLFCSCFLFDFNDFVLILQREHVNACEMENNKGM